MLDGTVVVVGGGVVAQAAEEGGNHELVMFRVTKQVLKPSKAPYSQFKVERGKFDLQQVGFGAGCLVLQCSGAVGVGDGGLDGGVALEEGLDVGIHEGLKWPNVSLGQGTTETNGRLEAGQCRSHNATLVDQREKGPVRTRLPKSAEGVPCFAHGLQACLYFEMRTIAFSVTTAKIPGVIRAVRDDDA